MPIVPEFDAQVAVRPVATPEVDAAALGKPGAAAAQGFGALSDQMQEFDRRYAEARRQADAANTTAAVSRQLDDLSVKYSKIPDRAQATSGYEQDSAKVINDTLDTIGDPLIKSYVTQRVSTENEARRLQVQERSFGLESSKRRGDLDQNLEQFAQSAAAAGNGDTGDTLRAKLTDDGIANIKGAVAAGWLQPEEGAQHELLFKSNVQRVRVQQLVNHALETQDPREVSNLARAVNDESTFPGLLPEQREQLGQHLENLSYRIESRTIARQAHEDAVSERNLRLGQDSNAAALLGQVYNGKTVDPATLEKLGQGGALSPSGMEALHSAQMHQDEGHDDAAVSVRTWYAIGRGEATPQDVYDQVRMNKLSANTASSMMKEITGGTTPAAKNALDVFKRAVTGSASGNFSFGGNTGEREMALANGLSEFHMRIAQGESPDDVLAETLPKYAPKYTTPGFLPPTRFGAILSTKDAAAVAAKTVAARDAHQIDDGAYAHESDLIRKYTEFYRAKEETARALATVRPKKSGPPTPTPEATP